LSMPLCIATCSTVLGCQCFLSWFSIGSPLLGHVRCILKRSDHLDPRACKFWRKGFFNSLLFTSIGCVEEGGSFFRIIRGHPDVADCSRVPTCWRSRYCEDQKAKCKNSSIDAAPFRTHPGNACLPAYEQSSG
jgi:hypothetical protein